MAFTKKQARSLAKAFRAQGKAVPAKIRRKIGRNPGTKAGARKARRKGRRKVLRRRRTAARRYRKVARGYKVVVRRKAGRRKSNRRFGRAHGIRTGRKGTISFRRRSKGRSRLVATNPRRKGRKGRRRNPSKRRRARGRRRNPGGKVSLASWQRGLTKSPERLMGLFKGKDMVSNIGFAVGGMVGGIAVGGLARGAILGALGQVAPGLVSNRLVQGVLSAAITYSGGYIVGTMAIKNERRRNAFITGAAAAAIVGLIMPGAVNRLLTGIPVLGPQLAKLPGMNGMGAYVSAPSYQGVGAYVSAPSYQGVGYDGDALAGLGYQDDALAGELGAYVEAPGYQGVGDLGMYGASHLD